ncbi:MAG: SLC13 family permease [Syntrophotaleaceae bacterium]
MTLVVVGLMLLALIREILAPDVIVFSALGVLLLTGVLTPQEALSGFSNSGVLTVGILFIVAYAAQSSGLLEFFADRVMGKSRNGRKSLLRMMVPVIGASAFLNNTPIVAMFTPTIRDWAIRNRLAPSKFLIPLSYASIFGGMSTLIGTSTNLVVNGMLQQSLGRSLSMFELTWIGIPCALAGTAFILFFGYRLLPDNTDLGEDFQRAGREYLIEMHVPEGSSLAGRTIEAAGLRHLVQAYLAEIVRNGETLAPVRPEEILKEGDTLFFSGNAEAAMRLQQVAGLSRGEEPINLGLVKSGRVRVLEAVVSRSSPMLGKTLKEGNFRARYDAAVLAVHRHGHRLQAGLGLLELKPGDTLLLLAGDDFFKRWKHSREFYMVSKVSDMPVLNRKKTMISLGSLFGMVALAAFGFLDILQAAILAAIVLLLTRSITVVEARRSIELNVLIVIAAALGISRALEKTGSASLLADWIISSVKDFGPIGLLAAIYLATSLMTELITNNAAAALVFPIAIAAAGQSGFDPMPFVIAVAIGASASFSTPIGYQTNLMVYGPGGYRFKDFLRVGIPLNLLFMAVAIGIIPLIWKF